MNNKRTLQLCVAGDGLLAVSAGAWGVVDGSVVIGVAAGQVSHERYLSGLLLAIGLGFWTTLPGIEGKGAAFRLLTALVVVGGLCRLVGVALGDGLSWPTAGPLVMELVVAPLLCLWRDRLDKRAPGPPRLLG